MQTYVLTLDCETCGEQMECRVGDLTSDPGEDLVVDVATTLSQIEFTCGRCGGVTYTGDFEDNCHHEPGTEPVDDDEEDDT